MISSANDVAIEERRAPDCEVSVVVPSYNSKRTIRACLGSIRGQRTSLAHEVIIVDSSDDGTAEVILHEFPEVTLVHFDERVRCGAARNLGVTRAGGSLILFVDTDCIVPPDWIERMVGAHRDLGADALCGALANGTPRSITGTLGYYLEFFRFIGPRGSAKRVGYLLGANSVYRRSLLVREHFPDRNLGDDFTLSWRLRRRGARLYFDPSIAVTHLNKTGVRRVLRYQYLLGRAAAYYRAISSPRLMALLRSCRFLVPLMPPLIVLRIGGIVMRRGAFRDACCFLVLLPLLLGANYVWALGFFRGLTHERLRDPARPRHR